MSFVKSLLLATALLTTQAAASPVPFVGCKSDGQVGPQDAPSPPATPYTAPASVAPYLAFYAASSGFGVLAPRNWHCFGYYGSSGTTLIVTPGPLPDVLAKRNIIGSDWAILGPAIQIDAFDEGTSGRFDVAAIAARLFPSYKKSLVDSVIAEKLRPASDFPFGPYPSDRLTRRSSRDVAFITPAHAQGMGTDSHLVANGAPISGEAWIGNGGAITLDVRLPPADANLAATIFNNIRPRALNAISQSD